MCLLHVLMELGGLATALSVLHVDHGLRGDGIARRRGVRASDLAGGWACRSPARGDRSPVRGNVEQAARKARLAFFHEHLARGSADRVAVGHTRTDQAETVLFRFLRGSGTAGLSGIRPVTAGGWCVR